MNLLADLTDVELVGKRVLLRVDLNVPIENGTVRDDFRIKRAIPTIKKLLNAGARVTLLSHSSEPGASLALIADYLQQFFPVIFVKNVNDVPDSAHWAEGSVVLLENLRLDPREENNSSEFAQELAKLGDIYINEDFPVSHRAHASIVSLPRLLPSYAGLQFAEEVKQLSELFKPEQPLVVIIAGAKFGTKLSLVQKFLPLAEKIFIGGALAHPIFKLLGYEIGQSLCDDSLKDLESLATDPKIVLPSEVLVKRGDEVGSTTPDQVPRDGIIVDAGPAALGQLSELISEAKTVLWNGPLGNYEQGFVSPTHDLAQVLAASGAHSVVGGGDTIAALEKLNLFDKFGFVSTGGGAMLDFLATGTLPGIEALEASEQKFFNK
ncbi:MAG: phosphoglycerate kinase [Patescibacteria group bacterium]